MALHALESTDHLDDDGEVDNVGAMADVGDDDFGETRFVVVELRFGVVENATSWVSGR